jgi:SynChlorMet cassette protein ScmC
VEVEILSKGEPGVMDMWNAMFPVYRKAARQGGMAIHAGLAELDGMGVLFAGAGGTGKSTCCRRLPDHWEKRCDDLTLVLPDRKGGYEAHPFPTWSHFLWNRPGDRTWNVAKASPLRAVFFLEQAARDEIIPLESGSRAALLMNGAATQVYGWFWRVFRDGQRRSLSRRVFENACDMARVVPAFILRLSLTGRFWELIERELLKRDGPP